jgi:hypothetical protein
LQTCGQNEEDPSQKQVITKGSLVEIMGCADNEEELMDGIGKVINFEASKFPWGDYSGRVRYHGGVKEQQRRLPLI